MVVALLLDVLLFVLVIGAMCAAALAVVGVGMVTFRLIGHR